MGKAQILLVSKQENICPIYRLSILRYIVDRKKWGAVTAGRRIYAGYYRRYAERQAETADEHEDFRGRHILRIR